MSVTSLEAVLAISHKVKHVHSSFFILASNWEQLRYPQHETRKTKLGYSYNGMLPKNKREGIIDLYNNIGIPQKH